MQIAVLLADRHQELAESFSALAAARGILPVFAIEHGLGRNALGELRQAVSRQLEEDPVLAGAAWSWSYLPLIVVTTEAGYRYRGTGTDFWPVVAQELGIEAGPAFRTGLSRLFELGHRSVRLARPGDSPWERQFPHISWPIGNSAVPLEIQPQLTDALRRAVRAGVPAEDTERLLGYMRTLAAGHSSRRFEHWLLHTDVAIEVMRRLLAPDAAGWLSQNVLRRIDDDIQSDHRAHRAITEARKAVAKRSARSAQIAPSHYLLALTDGAPTHLMIRGPALPAQVRDEVIASLGIHGDRLRAADSRQAIPLGWFLAGGDVALNSLCWPESAPLRRDEAIDPDRAAANAMLQRLQPRLPEFFLVEPNGLLAHAVFPDEPLPAGSIIMQCRPAEDGRSLETRRLGTSAADDVAFLRQHGFSIAEGRTGLQLIGLPVPGSPRSFFTGFPILVAGQGLVASDLRLKGSVAPLETVRIGGIGWTSLQPVVGVHDIEPADGRKFCGLTFEVIEPPDTEPAAVKLLPANADVADLEAGRLEIRISAPLALESVRVRVGIISRGEPALVSEGIIDRLPARLTGHSPILQEIQKKITDRPSDESGFRLSVEVSGLAAAIFQLQPVRRNLQFNQTSGKWTSTDDENQTVDSIGATTAAPLLGDSGEDRTGVRLVLPDAADHEALPAGVVLAHTSAARFSFTERIPAVLPPLLREPGSAVNGVGLTGLVRANVAWQLAEANNLLADWERWAVVAELEAALIEQLCGVGWRKLESAIDPSMHSEHGALVQSADGLGLISGEDLPEIPAGSDRAFLRQRLMIRFRDVVPDIREALSQWNDDLAGALDIAVIDAYEDLRRRLEAGGSGAFDEVDMSRPSATWRRALESSREIPLLPMFRPCILPAERWSALSRPWYGELSEDDLVDLLDSCHVDALRRPGQRWLGRPELRTMLQLWLSPRSMLETDNWKDNLARALSDMQTSRAVRYVALRRKLVLGELADRSAD